MASASPFGQRLRAWRKRRGVSQLDLALSAHTTPRYVSFIETGRSRPGRAIIGRLSDALGLSLREQNDLLRAAGLPPRFAETPLSDDDMAPVRRVIAQVLANHNPYPAWSFGPGLQFLHANEAAERLFPGMTSLSPEALVRSWCTPPPNASPEDAAHAVHSAVAALRQEQLHHPHPDLPKLLALAESLASAYPPVGTLHPAPVMCPTLVIQGTRVRTLSTVLRFDKATDVTMAELRVELVFPADDTADTFFRAAAPSHR